MDQFNTISLTVNILHVNSTSSTNTNSSTPEEEEECVFAAGVFELTKMFQNLLSPFCLHDSVTVLTVASIWEFYFLVESVGNPVNAFTELEKGTDSSKLTTE